MMMIIVIQGLAMALQAFAAFAAIRLISITGRYFAWLCIAISLLLIVARRSIAYFRLFDGVDQPVTASLWLETMALLVISSLQVIGILLIAPLFHSIKRAELRQRRLNAEIEQQVELRTRELHQTTEALVRANTDLEAANRDLERSNADLQSYASVASHDLQEPLRKITSFLSLLTRRNATSLDTESKHYIDIAVDGATRMQQMITDLLKFSRLRNHDTAPQPVACEQILTDVLADLSLQINDLQATITHDPLPIVIADEVRMHHLLQNLLGNALKFRGDRAPVVHIGVTRSGDYWQFTVADNGIGFEMINAERIFEIFQRLHRRDEYPGTGIGLALCRRIVETLGGSIWVESHPGKGTTFFFTLPAMTEQLSGHPYNEISLMTAR